MTDGEGSELKLILSGTPDMIVECVTGFVRELRSKSYLYECTPRVGDSPDYAKWDKTYSAYCDVFVTRQDSRVKIGTLTLRLIPNEQTLLIVKKPAHWDSPIGRFLGILLGEFKRLGFMHFEEKKPPLGFKLPHKEEDRQN